MASGMRGWSGDKIAALIRAELGRRIQACAIAVWARAKDLINVEGAGTVGEGKRKKLVYNENPSKPGEPPHKQTGRLLGSVAWEFANLAARVGTNVLYGRWLELGTKHMAARPWLRRALQEMRAAIRAIINRPMSGGG